MASAQGWQLKMGEEYLLLVVQKVEPDYLYQTKLVSRNN